MAKATKIGDKLAKVGECVNIYFYDNAYMVEANGRDKKDNWCSVKLMCKDLDEVSTLLSEVETLPKDSQREAPSGASFMGCSRLL